MNLQHRALSLFVCLGLVGFGHVALAERSNTQGAQAPKRVRRVDLVLALDTSSSMNGLIDAARQKMWDVVNLLDKAQPKPELRVGLIAYGNTGYDAKTGWVQTQIDLTTDLDTVYGKLFGLTTNGGDEYVARAVKVATRELSWSKDQDALRIIFVAGNEAATQDPIVKLEDAIGDAREHGIYVNAIFCGPERAGDAVGWARVASLGKGQFAAIDHNHVVAIATPQDAELGRLSDELSKTYVAYGDTGAGHLANQVAQDRNASSASAPAAAARAAGKASGLYKADDWDLVDATRGKKRDVRHMSTAELPAEMREMKPEARAAFVEAKAKKREELQKRIKTVNTEREHYVSEQRKRPATNGAKPQTSMDDALVGGIRKEAEATGFTF